MWGASVSRPSQLLIVILLLALVLPPHASEARASPGLAGVPRGARKLNQALLSPPAPTSDTTTGTRTTTGVSPPPPN
ncbi:hypothetical protein ACP70R_030557 [Stipagrostis hirtigluma subsp. patula]